MIILLGSRLSRVERASVTLVLINVTPVGLEGFKQVTCYGGERV